MYVDRKPFHAPSHPSFLRQFSPILKFFRNFFEKFPNTITTLTQTTKGKRDDGIETERWIAQKSHIKTRCIFVTLKRFHEDIQFDIIEGGIDSNALHYIFRFFFPLDPWYLSLSANFTAIEIQRQQKQR